MAVKKIRPKRIIKNKLTRMVLIEKVIVKYAIFSSYSALQCYIGIRGAIVQIRDAKRGDTYKRSEKHISKLVISKNLANRFYVILGGRWDSCLVQKKHCKILNYEI